MPEFLLNGEWITFASGTPNQRAEWVLQQRSRNQRLKES